MDRVYVEKSGLAQWAYYLIGMILLPTWGAFIWSLYRQYLNKPSGGSVKDEYSLLVATIFFTILIIAIFWLIITIKAEIKVADRTISLRFPPFINRTRSYLFTDIEKWSIEKRNLFSLGIGLRYDPVRKSWIYSLGTKHVLMLTLVSGKRIMMSTKKPYELQRSLEITQKKDYE